ncbi:arabinofuranosyltransferase [Corynebacterium suedekumii]|nr:arabinofuranosyltransferase [Corynebacterium suedekumii]
MRFAAALDEVKWRSPDVFILRGELDDPEAGWKTHVSEDIYPNNPNVRYRGLQFNSAPFLDDPEMWDVAQIGPFVVASRLSQ